MGASTFQALVGDLHTGKITARLPLTSCPWQQVNNAAGTIGPGTINLADVATHDLDMYNLTATARTYLGVQFEDEILCAGPIWSRHYNRSSDILTLTAGGLWSLFDHRMIVPVLIAGAAAAAVVDFPATSGLSFADIAAQLAALAMAHVGGDLPLVLPDPQGDTPGATRTFNGYNLTTFAAAFTNLSTDLSGPEIRFQPRYQAGDPTSIEWVMQAGTPDQPLLVQAGDDWLFDASVPKSMVSDIDYDEDATAMGTRAWEVGAGSQAGTVMSKADYTELTDAGYPLLEVVDRAHSSDAVQGDLDAYATQYLAVNNRPSTVWKLTVRNDGGAPSGPTGPRLGQYTPGETCQVIIGADDHFLPVGAHRARILQIDGNVEPGLDSTITLATMAAEV